MRRAQSVRNYYPRPSLAQVDDLGILRESEDSESVEDVLRKQLMDKERECDKVCVVFLFGFLILYTKLFH